MLQEPGGSEALVGIAEGPADACEQYRRIRDIASHSQLAEIVAPIVYMYTRSRLPRSASRDCRSRSSNVYEKPPPPVSLQGLSFL